jgi:hypothetical protein
MRGKRDSDDLIKIIIAADIGTLTEQNLAEVFGSIAGVQATLQCLSFELA